jgi:hypothetical protein
VTLRPWFGGLKEERSFVYTVSRILSGHCSVRPHLGRFRIVEDLMCVCAGNYETVDHLIWHCERFRLKRHRLIDALAALNVSICFCLILLTKMEFLTLRWMKNHLENTYEFLTVMIFVAKQFYVSQILCLFILTLRLGFENEFVSAMMLSNFLQIFHRSFTDSKNLR